MVGLLLMVGLFSVLPAQAVIKDFKSFVNCRDTTIFKNTALEIALQESPLSSDAKKLRFYNFIKESAPDSFIGKKIDASKYLVDKYNDPIDANDEKLKREIQKYDDLKSRYSDVALAIINSNQINLPEEIKPLTPINNALMGDYSKVVVQLLDKIPKNKLSDLLGGKNFDDYSIVHQIADNNSWETLHELFDHNSYSTLIMPLLDQQSSKYKKLIPLLKAIHDNSVEVVGILRNKKNIAATFRSTMRTHRGQSFDAFCIANIQDQLSMRPVLYWLFDNAQKYEDFLFPELADEVKESVSANVLLDSLNNNDDQFSIALLQVQSNLINQNVLQSIINKNDSFFAQAVEIIIGDGFKSEKSGIEEILINLVGTLGDESKKSALIRVLLNNFTEIPDTEFGKQKATNMIKRLKLLTTTVEGKTTSLLIFLLKILFDNQSLLVKVMQRKSVIEAITDAIYSDFGQYSSFRLGHLLVKFLQHDQMTYLLKQSNTQAIFEWLNQVWYREQFNVVEIAVIGGDEKMINILLEYISKNTDLVHLLVENNGSRVWRIASSDNIKNKIVQTLRSLNLLSGEKASNWLEWYDKCEKILDSQNLKINSMYARDNDGNNILSQAIIANNQDIAEALVSLPWFGDPYLNLLSSHRANQNNEGLYPLELALQNNMDNVVIGIIDAFNKHDIFYFDYGFNKTIFELVEERGSDDVKKYLSEIVKDKQDTNNWLGGKIKIIKLSSSNGSEEDLNQDQLQPEIVSEPHLELSSSPEDRIKEMWTEDNIEKRRELFKRLLNDEQCARLLVGAVSKSEESEEWKNFKEMYPTSEDRTIFQEAAFLSEYDGVDKNFYYNMLKIMPVRFVFLNISNSSNTIFDLLLRSAKINNQDRSLALIIHKIFDKWNLLKTDVNKPEKYISQLAMKLIDDASDKIIEMFFDKATAENKIDDKAVEAIDSLCAQADGQGNSAIFVAIKKNRQVFIEKFLNFIEKNLRPLIDIKNQSGDSLLISAIKNNNQNLSGSLFDKFVALDKKDMQEDKIASFLKDFFGNNILHCALQVGNVDLIKYFIDNHNNLARKQPLLFEENNQGDLPLMLGARNNPEIIRKLLNVQWTDQGKYYFAQALTREDIFGCGVWDVVRDPDLKRSVVTFVQAAGIVQWANYVLGRLNSLASEGIAINQLDQADAQGSNLLHTCLAQQSIDTGKAQQLVWRYPVLMRRVDGQGRNPLHVMVSFAAGAARLDRFLRDIGLFDNLLNTRQIFPLHKHIAFALIQKDGGGKDVYELLGDRGQPGVGLVKDFLARYIQETIILFKMDDNDLTAWYDNYRNVILPSEELDKLSPAAINQKLLKDLENSSNLSNPIKKFCSLALRVLHPDKAGEGAEEITRLLNDLNNKNDDFSMLLREQRIKKEKYIVAIAIYIELCLKELIRIKDTIANTKTVLDKATTLLGVSPATIKALSPSQNVVENK